MVIMPSTKVNVIKEGGEVMVKATLPTQQELARRQALRDQQADEIRDKAALVFMCQWMKRKGVEKDKLQALGVWSDAEMRQIDQIYKYSY
jgi:hypothetical protein